MADQASDIEGLKKLVVFLLRRVKEASIEASTVRYLAELHGVFSREEYEKIHAEASTEWDRAVAEAVTESTAAAIDAKLQQLFQSQKHTDQ